MFYRITTTESFVSIAMSDAQNKKARTTTTLLILLSFVLAIIGAVNSEEDFGVGFLVVGGILFFSAIFYQIYSYNSACNRKTEKLEEEYRRIVVHCADSGKNIFEYLENRVEVPMNESLMPYSERIRWAENVYFKRRASIDAICIENNLNLTEKEKMNKAMSMENLEKFYKKTK